jgi:hypothetical protein
MMEVIAPRPMLPPPPRMIAQRAEAKAKVEAAAAKKLSHKRTVSIAGKKGTAGGRAAREKEEKQKQREKEQRGNHFSIPSFIHPYSSGERYDDDDNRKRSSRRRASSYRT